MLELCVTGKEITMGSKDPRIDTYIAKFADFAKPILTHIRKLVHANCPDATEAIKWGMPFFEYKRRIFFQHGGLQGALRIWFLARRIAED